MDQAINSLFRPLEELDIIGRNDSKLISSPIQALNREFSMDIKCNGNKNLRRSN